MEVLYRAKVDTESDWRGIDPDKIYDHDFLGHFLVKVVFDSGEVREPTTYDAYLEAVQEGEAMADYGKAEPEAGEIRSAVNPSHYKTFMVIEEGDEIVAEIQWFEHFQYMPFYRTNPMAMYHLAMAQADKYNSRIGLKDNPVQEAKKALWYHCFAVAFLANDMKPIKVKNILELLQLEFT